MVELTREAIFDQAAKKLRQDFDELSTVPHRGLKGSEAERLVRDFLNGHIPRRFEAGAGFIVDRFDSVSKQTDLVIYDALNCPVYRASSEAAILPNDNVAAVVEVKSVIDKERLREASQNIAAAKSLAKSRGADTGNFTTHATLGCVFAFSSAVTLEKLGEHYESLIREAGSLGTHIDLLVVLDVGIVSLLAKVPGELGWAPIVFSGATPEAEGVHLAVGVNAVGKDSLDMFLRLLLAHLALFREVVDHPGFDWQKTASGGMGLVRYLSSITFETDPVEKEKRLAEYRKQVEDDFAAKAKPHEGE
jgi:hypothetical protein